MKATNTQPNWSLMSNHGHVLVCIANEPTIRIREVAVKAGITERAAHRIVRELEAAGFLSHEKVGRRNLYHVDHAMRSPHPLERQLDVVTLANGSMSSGRKGAP